MTERREAVIPVSQQTFEALLRLPPGMHITGVRDDWLNRGVLVLVEDDQLDPVPEATTPPRLHGSWHVRDGVVRWEPPAKVTT